MAAAEGWEEGRGGAPDREVDANTSHQAWAKKKLGSRNEGTRGRDENE